MIDLLIHTDRRYATALAQARRARNEAIRALAGTLLRLPVRAARTVVRWQQRRRLVAELRALDDLMLADIGIFRGDIRPTVDELLRRQQSGGRVAEPASHDDARPAEIAWFGRPHRLAPQPATTHNTRRTAA